MPYRLIVLGALILGCLHPPLLRATAVRGIVQSATTREPIAGAIISVSGNSERSPDLTDVRGVFKIELVGIHPGQEVVLHVEKPGYEPVIEKVAASEDEIITILLVPRQNSKAKNPTPQLAATPTSDPILYFVSELKIADASGRENAAHALGNLGSTSKPVVQALTQALTDPENSVRISAAQALAKIKPTTREPVPALIICLEDQRSPSLRAEAANALDVLGPLAASAAGPLEVALADQDETVRLNAAMALIAISKDAKAAGMVCDALLHKWDERDLKYAEGIHDNEVALRLQLANHLLKMGGSSPLCTARVIKDVAMNTGPPEESVKLLLQLDPTVGLSLADQMNDYQAEKVFSALHSLCESTPQLRPAAVELAEGIRHSLTSATSNDVITVALQAISFLKDVDPSSVAENTKLEISALERCSASQCDYPLGPLARLVVKADQSERQNAINALRNAASGSNCARRVDAAEALNELGYDPNESLRIGLGDTGDGDSSCRNSAISLVGEILRSSQLNRNFLVDSVIPKLAGEALSFGGDCGFPFHEPCGASAQALFECPLDLVTQFLVSQAANTTTSSAYKDRLVELLLDTGHIQDALPAFLDILNIFQQNEDAVSQSAVLQVIGAIGKLGPNASSAVPVLASLSSKYKKYPWVKESIRSALNNIRTGGSGNASNP